jgi:hypothetical protein
MKGAGFESDEYVYNNGRAEPMVTTPSTEGSPSRTSGEIKRDLYELPRLIKLDLRNKKVGGCHVLDRTASSCR